MANLGGTSEDTIGDLFDRLIDDGGDLVRAEIGLYRELAYGRLLASRTALILAACGILLAFGSAAALMVGLMMALARWTGPLGAGVAVAVAGLLAAGLMLRAAMRLIAPPPGRIREDRS